MTRIWHILHVLALPDEIVLTTAVHGQFRRPYLVCFVDGECNCIWHIFLRQHRITWIKPFIVRIWYPI